MNANRQITKIDALIGHFDRGLRTLIPGAHSAARGNPSDSVVEGELSEQERAHAAALMRVNHAGEVCAQALYQGQALTARSVSVKKAMEHSATEEIDHLAWCEQRLQQLNARTSWLNPMWYGASLALGAGAGIISDRLSLGFVAATEDQVCAHLKDHLNRLPESDGKSRAIVSQMHREEQRHGQAALKAGGWHFPLPVRKLMRNVSRVMTSASYRL